MDQAIYSASVVDKIFNYTMIATRITAATAILVTHMRHQLGWLIILIHAKTTLLGPINTRLERSRLSKLGSYDIIFPYLHL
jgi:hypothetical protein